MPDPDLLKVAPGASLADLKRAYRKAALAHHPDQNPHPDAARHFRRLTEAYRILEAEAQRREPPRPRRKPTWDERLGYTLGEIAALARRWPQDRWQDTVGGLPAGVWVASSLEVLARAWSGEVPRPVLPTLEGVEQALADWRLRRQTQPLGLVLPRARTKALEAVFQAVEARLDALKSGLARP